MIRYKDIAPKHKIQNQRQVAMARAKAGRRQTPRLYHLDITEGEADFLIGILAHAGGHKTNSPRKYAERIYKALVRVTKYSFEGSDAYQHSYGHVEFEDYDQPPVSFERQVESWLNVVPEERVLPVVFALTALEILNQELPEDMD